MQDKTPRTLFGWAPNQRLLTEPQGRRFSRSVEKLLYLADDLDDWLLEHRHDG